MKIRFDEYSNSEYVTSWDTGKIDSLNDVAEIENAAEVEEIDVADYAVSVEAQEVAVNAEIENAKNAKAKVKAKIADLRAAEKIISEKYLSLCRSLYVKNDGEYHSAIGFDDYATKYADTFYYKDGDNYVEDTEAYSELKAIGVRSGENDGNGGLGTLRRVELD